MGMQYLQFQKVPPKNPIPPSAKIWGSQGSQALHRSQGRLFLTDRLHPRLSRGTFGLTKPARVLCLMRHLFLINICFKNRGQGGTCSGMQSDYLPYTDTNHIFLYTYIHLFIYKTLYIDVKDGFYIYKKPYI